MTYPNGAQTVFQITCMGSVYSVEDGFSEMTAKERTLKRSTMLGKFSKRFQNGSKMLRK